MKIGYIRNDDDGHWYVIPEDKIYYFDQFIWDNDDWEEWEPYDEYRLDGGIEDLKVIMEE